MSKFLICHYKKTPLGPAYNNKKQEMEIVRCKAILCVSEVSVDNIPVLVKTESKR